MIGESERLIKFPKSRVVIFSVFIFCSDWIVDGPACAGLFSSARNQEPLSAKLLLKKRLTSADSGVQLDLEIALSGFPAKVQAPRVSLNRPEDALKRRMT